MTGVGLFGPEVHFAHGGVVIPPLRDDLHGLDTPRSWIGGKQVDLDALPVGGGNSLPGQQGAVLHGVAVLVVEEETTGKGELASSGVAIMDAEHDGVLGAQPAAAGKGVGEDAEVSGQDQLL